MSEKDPGQAVAKKKQWAYRALLKGQDGQINEAAKIALADLRVFCHGTRSVFSSDSLEMARRAGKQEVFQRIMNFLEMEYAETYQLEEDFDDLL